MKRWIGPLLLGLLIAWPAIAQEHRVFSGDVSFLGNLGVPIGSTLPASPRDGDFFMVTDDPTVGACTSAGGSAVSTCVRIGGAWVSAGLADGAFQAADADLTDLADGILTFSKVGGATVNRCARWDASGNLAAATGDCANGDTGGGGGVSVALDLLDDSVDESAALVRVNVVNDDNGIFAESTPNELSIDVYKAWAGGTNCLVSLINGNCSLSQSLFIVGDADADLTFDFDIRTASFNWYVGDKTFGWEGTVNDGFETLLGVENPTADLRFNLPDGPAGTYQVATRTMPETLTGKTIAVASNTISGTAARCARFGAGGALEASGADCGATLLIEEADGAPSVSATRVQFDQADGFTVTNEGSGQVQIDLVNLPDGVVSDTLTIGASSVVAGAAITAGTVGDTALAAGAVDGGAGGEIADNTITVDDIAADGVGASEIAADAVGASEIAALAVGNAELANDSVDAAKVATDAIGAPELATGAVAAIADLASGIRQGAGTHVQTVSIGADTVTNETQSSANTVVVNYVNPGAGGVSIQAEAHPTLGGTFGAKEGQDDGTNIAQFKVPDAGLGADRTCTIVDAADFIPDACIQNALTISSSGSVDGAALNAGTIGDGALAAGAVDGGAGGEIADGSIAYVDLQDISATSRVLGRATAGAGVTEELTASQVLGFISTTQGVILYRDAAAYAALAVGTAGQVLQTGGAAANPSWRSIPRYVETDAARCDASTGVPVWSLPTANAPAAACSGAAPDSTGWLDFADGANALTAEFRARLKDWDGGVIAFDLTWACTSGAGCSTNSVVWKIATACVADDEDSNNPTFNAAQSITTAASATRYNRKTSSVNLTTTGCAASETLKIQVQRDPTDGSDTLAATAGALGAVLKFGVL